MINRSLSPRAFLPWLGILLLFLAGFAAPTAASAPGMERVKDLASVGGVRNNQLVGYGLVVGLD
ncbi:flagellar basal body P-ring protein FlgI, partial [Arthrospira platensis SPKY2]